MLLQSGHRHGQRPAPQLRVEPFTDEGSMTMTVFCGIDWAENHHDVALVDEHGTALAKVRISDDAEGFACLLGLLSEHGDTQGHLIPVAIETGRGLLVACLQATGRDIHVINPMAASRYRERKTVARSKSDAVDALGQHARWLA